VALSAKYVGSDDSRHGSGEIPPRKFGIPPGYFDDRLLVL